MALPFQHISIILPYWSLIVPTGVVSLVWMFAAFKLFHVTKDVQETACVSLGLDVKAFQACFKDERLKKAWCVLTG